MNLFDKYKTLQAEAEVILCALRDELNRIVSLNPIEAKCKVDSELSLLHNEIYASENSSINLLMGVQSKLGIFFYTFQVNIPFNIFFKSDEIVINFWKNNDRIKYFQKKFVK